VCITLTVKKNGLGLKKISYSLKGKKMKEWIMELCPEIKEWQAEMIAEEVERQNKTPTKLMAIPALMEAAGWVRKKEWVGLTEEEKDSFVGGRVDSYTTLSQIEAKLKEKNSG
jgi:hypothetical protein